MPTTLPARSATLDLNFANALPLIAIVAVTILLVCLFPAWRDATVWYDEYQTPLIGP